MKSLGPLFASFAMLGLSFSLQPERANAGLLTYSRGDGGAYSEIDATYVRESNPNTNYDGEDVLKTDRDTFTGNQYALVGFFDVFGDNPGQISLGTGIVSASLSLTVTGNASPKLHSVHRHVGDWDEETLTWNTLGDFGTLVTTFTPSTPFEVLELDITSAVQAWSDGEANQGLIISQGSTDGLVIYSDDYDDPRNTFSLSIETHAVPEPSSMALFGLGALGMMTTRRRKRN